MRQYSRRVILKKLIVLLIVFSSVFSCNKHQSQGIKVDTKQNGFDSVTISVFREKAGKRTYLANKEARVIMMDLEVSAKTDDSGLLNMKVPVEMTMKMDKITVIVDGNPHDVPFMKKKILFKRTVEYQVASYKHFIFQIKQVRIEESAPGSSLEEVGGKPFEGKVVFRLSGNAELVKYTGDGKIDLILEDDEMKRFVTQPEMTIAFEDGNLWTARIELPPVTGQVEIKEVNQTEDRFAGVLANGTFETAKVVLRAGYVRYGDEWFIGKVLSRKYFEEKEYELLPGETKKIELSYPKPPLGDKQLKYKLEVRGKS